MSPRHDRRLFDVVLHERTAEVRFVDAYLDERNAEAMQEQVNGLLERLGSREVVFDLGNIVFVSSTWLGQFVTLFRGLRAAGGRISLCNVTPEIYEVFRTTRLTDLMEVREKEEKVLSSS